MIVSELVSLLGFKVDGSGARQFDAQLNQLESKANAVSTGIATALSGAVLFAVAQIGQYITAALADIPKAGDAMNSSLQKIESSIGRSATSGAEASEVYEQLYEMGKRTGVGADESAQAFTRFNIAMQDLKRPASDTVKFIEGIQSAAIVAGTSGAELTSVMTQLGQALGSGKLQGEELNTMRENMPRFLRDTVKELGMEMDAFFKLAEKGELKPALIIPAMMKASKTAQDELKNFPIGMARSFTILNNSVKRFAADLDRTFNISGNIAKVFMAIARTLDSWRSGFSVVSDFIRELGGMYDVLQLVGIAMLVAFGVAPILKLISIINIMGMAIARAFLPLALFGIFVLAIEDFVAWTQGKNSFFGDFFGPFQQAIEPIKPQLEAIKSWFETNFNFGSLLENTKREFTALYESLVGIWEALKNFWNSNVEGMKPQFDWLINAVGLLMSAWRPLSEFFVSLFNTILGAINPFYDRVMSVVNTIKGAVQGLINLIPGLNAAGGEGAGAMATGSDAGQDARRRNFGARGALADGFINPDLARELSGMLAPLPDVSGRVGGAGGATVNAPQSNNINNNVTVNAPAADPASVAAGASSGVNQATRDMVSRLGSLGLGLGMSNPRVEAPAAP